MRLARNPAGALADVIDGAARSFHGVLMEADFPIMSGMEAALKFRSVPLSAGWGKARPLIVMVVNGSPLANYQVRKSTAQARANYQMRPPPRSTNPVADCLTDAPPTNPPNQPQGFEAHSLQAGVDFVANSFEDISFPNLKAHFLRQVNKQSNRQTDRQTDRQTESPTVKQTDRQTDRHDVSTLPPHKFVVDVVCFAH